MFIVLQWSKRSRSLLEYLILQGCTICWTVFKNRILQCSTRTMLSLKDVMCSRWVTRSLKFFRDLQDADNCYSTNTSGGSTWCRSLLEDVVFQWPTRRWSQLTFIRGLQNAVRFWINLLTGVHEKPVPVRCVICSWGSSNTRLQGDPGHDHPLYEDG